MGTWFEKPFYCVIYYFIAHLNLTEGITELYSRMSVFNDLVTGNNPTILKPADPAVNGIVHPE